MKKLAILALAGLIILTSAAPYASAAVLNDQRDCNNNHMSCREYCLNMDAPWYKMMVLLTACDIAFGKCMLSI